MSECYLDELQKPDQTVNPLFTFLGAKLLCAAAGEAVLTLPVTASLAQGAGLVAGGMLATLADEAMAHAVLSQLKTGQKTVTAEMNIRYLRAANPARGGLLTGKARVIKTGRKIMVTQADIYDADNRHLATAGGSFWVVAENE